MGHEIYVCRQVKGLGHREAAGLVKKAVKAALLAEGVESPCVVSVMFTDGPGIRDLNRRFRGVDRETDVLSFPLNQLRPGAFEPESCEREAESGAVLLGDILLSLPRCESQGAEYGHGFARELQYLSVHSLLHLLGYDHEDEGEQKRLMRSREKAIMGGLL